MEQQHTASVWPAGLGDSSDAAFPTIAAPAGTAAFDASAVALPRQRREQGEIPRGTPAGVLSMDDRCAQTERNAQQVTFQEQAHGYYDNLRRARRSVAALSEIRDSPYPTGMPVHPPNAPEPHGVAHTEWRFYAPFTQASTLPEQPPLSPSTTSEPAWTPALSFTSSSLSSRRVSEEQRIPLTPQDEVTSGQAMATSHDKWKDPPRWSLPWVDGEGAPLAVCPAVEMGTGMPSGLAAPFDHRHSPAVPLQAGPSTYGSLPGALEALWSSVAWPGEDAAPGLRYSSRVRLPSDLAPPPTPEGGKAEPAANPSHTLAQGFEVGGAGMWMAPPPQELEDVDDRNALGLAGVARISHPAIRSRSSSSPLVNRADPTFTGLENSAPPQLHPPSASMGHRRPPSATDMAAAGEERPQTQRIRFVEDQYTPLWVRHKNGEKEGFCSLCPADGKWLQLKNSAFWYHKQFQHGVSSVTGQYFLPPLEIRQLHGSQAVDGLCHACRQWVAYKSQRPNPLDAPTPWYKHAHKCHGSFSRDGGP